MTKKSERWYNSPAFYRTIHSIRTRYGVVTAVFLLLFLLAFYIGGRFVLANLVHDTAAQVREVGVRVTSQIQRQSDRVRDAVKSTFSAPNTTNLKALDIISATNLPFNLVVRLTPSARLIEGYTKRSKNKLSIEPLTTDHLNEYRAVLHNWIVAIRDKKAKSSASEIATGILRTDTRLYNSAIIPYGTNEFLLVGVPFTTAEIANIDKQHSSGLEVQIHSDVRPRVHAETDPCHANAPHDVHDPRSYARSTSRSTFGIAPMFTENAIERAHDDDEASAFWVFKSNPLESVFVLRDISGNAVSVLSVSLPKVFSAATRMAVWQLAFFIAVGGIFFVLPIFWIQNRLLLNPLSKMTSDIEKLSSTDFSIDCPHIAWTGKDEFAVLADSVNRLVEAIAAKTVTLANVEARHKALLSAIPDGLFIGDANCRLISITKELDDVPPMPGIVIGEEPLRSVYGDESVDAFRRTIKETAETGKVGHIHISARNVPGAAAAPGEEPRRHFEIRFSRMSDHFVLSLMRDVTADTVEHRMRLIAEEHGADATKHESLTNFAAGIAHDMNNVLSVVLGAAESAAAEIPNNDGAQAAMETVREGIRRGSAMMREIMTFAGENKINLQRANPKLVLEDVRQLTSQLVGPNIEISFSESPDLPDVDVDLNQFWKVLFNIVKNAAEAIGKNPGSISLSVDPYRMTTEDAMTFRSEKPIPAGGGVAFRIIDDGPGIPDELVRRLFDPYVSSKGLGRGLGLATVRTIVEAHGGGIRVTSKVERGTEFTIYLPATNLPVTIPTMRMKPISRDSILGKTKSAAPAPVFMGELLIVDDDEAILKTTSIICRALKIHSYVARDRREALDVLRRYTKNIKAVVLDAHLGIFDTVRLLGAMRQTSPGIKIIVASGSAPETMEKMFKAHPYDVFLAKPYTLAEFRDALTKVASIQNDLRA